MAGVLLTSNLNPVNIRVMVKKLLVVAAFALAFVAPVVATETSSKAGEFRQQRQVKLEEIKDVRKKKLAETLSTSLCRVNKNRTAGMARNLATMTNILNRVEERTAKAKGKDTASVATAVATARQAIADAQAAVGTQSTADCSINFSGDEGKLRTEAQAARQTLANNLKRVRDKVTTARQATTAAVKVLAQVLGETSANEK